MGGSKSKDVKKTTINTTTSTTMRDVGLTGANAVDMAAILQTGAIENTRISAASLDTLIQQTGKTAQQLIGGASDLVRTSGDIAKGGSDMMKLAPFAVVAVVAVMALTMKSRSK